MPTTSRSRSSSSGCMRINSRPNSSFLAHRTAACCTLCLAPDQADRSAALDTCRCRHSPRSQPYNLRPRGSSLYLPRTLLSLGTKSHSETDSAGACVAPSGPHACNSGLWLGHGGAFTLPLTRTLTSRIAVAGWPWVVAGAVLRGHRPIFLCKWAAIPTATTYRTCPSFA